MIANQKGQAVFSCIFENLKLSPLNVYEAVTLARPFGADSCTRTNALDNTGRPIRFKKDYEKVKVFVQEVRRAEKDLFDLRQPPM